MYGVIILLSLVTVFYSVVNMFTAPEFKVQQGIVLISGASTGIGRHAAEHLAELGYTVFAGVRKQSDFDSLSALNIPNLYPLKFDVTDHDSCVAAITHVSEVSETMNLPFAALVNNAGVARREAAEFHSLSDARAVFDTNFFGMVDLTQLSLPLLRKSQGRILMISSIAGIFGTPSAAIYASSKHAMEGFADSLRRSVRHHGVAVSIIEPAYVKSALATKAGLEQNPSPELAALYPSIYSEAAEKKRLKGIAGGDEPTVTTDAIVHAITAPTPRTRYPVANFNGIPSQLIVYMIQFMPDYAVDFIFTIV